MFDTIGLTARATYYIPSLTIFTLLHILAQSNGLQNSTGYTGLGGKRHDQLDQHHPQGQLPRSSEIYNKKSGFLKDRYSVLGPLNNGQYQDDAITGPVQHGTLLFRNTPFDDQRYRMSPRLHYFNASDNIISSQPHTINSFQQGQFTLDCEHERKHHRRLNGSPCETFRYLQSHRLRYETLLNEADGNKNTTAVRYETLLDEVDTDGRNFANFSAHVRRSHKSLVSNTTWNNQDGSVGAHSHEAQRFYHEINLSADLISTEIYIPFTSLPAEPTETSLQTTDSTTVPTVFPSLNSSTDLITTVSTTEVPLVLPREQSTAQSTVQIKDLLTTTTPTVPAAPTTVGEPTESSTKSTIDQKLSLNIRLDIRFMA